MGAFVNKTSGKRARVRCREREGEQMRMCKALFTKPGPWPQDFKPLRMPRIPYCRTGEVRGGKGI